MICERCQTEFEASDSIGCDSASCQDCWERECSWQWWAMVAALQFNEDIPVMTEHDLPRIYAPDAEGENPKDRIGQTKPPLHLIPPAAEVLESIVMGLGAKKYGGPFNWRSAKVRATVYIAAAKRHLAQWLDGESNDAESGVSHLAHARACLGILLDAQATGNMVDDRPPPGVATVLIEQHTGNPPLVQEPGQ
jgi:hypothetical protein